MKFLKCKKCGDIVILASESKKDLCDDAKIELVPNTSDGAGEKHVPVVTVNGNNVHVEVGSVIHPMSEVHLIEFVVLETKKGFQVKYLSPTDKPIVDFVADDEVVAVYEYCNLHGLWKTEL